MATVKFGGSLFLQGAYDKMEEVKFGTDKGIIAMGMSIDTKNFVGPAKATDLRDVVNKAQAEASKVMAEKAVSTMSSWFTKKGPNAVGIAWTGKSAQGLRADVVSGTPGRVLYTITEHRRALRLIRQGLRPGNNGPHSKAIEKWAKDKKLEPQPTYEITAYKVMSSVHKNGMSKWWEERIPVTKGKRFFNYPQHYREDYLPQDAESLMRKMTEGGIANTPFGIAITSVAMGVLSSARFQTSGKEKVHTGFYGVGQRGREGSRKPWMNASFSFFSGAAEFGQKVSKMLAPDDASMDYEPYVDKVRRRIDRLKGKGKKK